MLKLIEKNKTQEELDKILERQAIRFASSEEKAVSEIVHAVIERGDEALLEYAQKFDDKKFTLAKLCVTEEALDAAQHKVSREFKSALSKAIQNIRAYHCKQKPDEWFETLPLDVVLGQRLLPLQKVGIYVPGGRAIYPSSVLMNAIPAQVAGVKEIIMVSPPPINSHVLYAARELGITAVFQVGGAQAIAALAAGTKTIPRVDKIVGPGNIYVTIAKKLVCGMVGIDSLAGPSNVVIVADHDAEPEFLAADLLSQVEHDPSSFAVLITYSEKVARETEKQVERQMKKAARCKIMEEAEIRIFLVEGRKKAVEIVNQIGPEHLELQMGSPQRLLEHIHNAGAVFLGPYSPVPVGDYLAGPSHVLPTGGTARFASPLGVYDFVKTQSIIGYTKPALKNIWKDIKVLAEVEGLDAHAHAIDVRFR